MLIPFAFAQLDDSNTKYQRVEWIAYYPEARNSMSDQLQSILISERERYEFKSENPIIQDKRIGDLTLMYGSLTFRKSIDAQWYYLNIITTMRASDVVYAKVQLLDNSHHWTDNKIEPDDILGQTIYGEPNFALLRTP